MLFKAPDKFVLPEVPDYLSLEQFMYIASKPSDKDVLCSGLSDTKFRNLKEMKVFTDNLASSIAPLLDVKKNWSGTLATGKPGHGEFDRSVVLYSENSVYTLPIQLAVHRLLGVVAPTSTAMTAKEVVHQLKLSEAKIIITSKKYLPNVLEAIKITGHSRSKVFLTDEVSHDGFVTVKELASRGSLMPRAPVVVLKPGEAKERVAFLSQSSGTSGLPKGIKISHFNVIANILQINVLYPEETLKVNLALLPLYHIYGLVVVLYASMHAGSQLVVLPEFNYELLLQTTEKFKLTTLFVVPPILVRLLNDLKSEHPIAEKYNLTSIERFMTGAAPFSKEQTEALFATPWAKRHNFVLVQAYGATEMSPMGCTQRGDSILSGASGYVCPGAVVRVVDPETLKDVEDPETTQGELWYKGPNVVLGYVDNAKGVRGAVAPGFLTPDGYYRTGDEVLFKKDKHGEYQVVVVDRLKELIKTKGFQVAPAELEGVILSHPAVADCCVIGIPDERAGELPRAYIKLSPNATREGVEQSVYDFVKKEKARYKWLDGGVVIIDEIPKSPSGKILRRFLRDKARAEYAKQHAKSKL
ncbi:hypothetical protein CANCADRAFT_1480 [Tortispora caseinolytica NRRL Y-17796]|uniref:AMP-dependent synthetase/ligase domain-containing protein n=1 Tax=Tortispora caseinolytica NRRL Y-17796 TaxID=767744 RepID=A0A1E4TM95_9ASCO|nr:hypothetical protein CANCADRAFT_1480 [Tortispora caseinolytica NRRL Y-17796]